MKLVLLLISVYVIVRVKPTPFWDMIFFFLHKGHQILQKKSYIRRMYPNINGSYLFGYILIPLE